MNINELRKLYTPVIDWLANNFKSCIKDDSINVDLLYLSTIKEFPHLNCNAINALVRKMCTQIEIDSISSGVNIEDIKVRVSYRKDDK